jgi:hypothetical protein
MNITQDAANHAANMIDGIISHPFWNGIDREALTSVRDALRSGSVTIEDEVDEDEELPDWGIPGDAMIYKGSGGYPGEIEQADKMFHRDVEYIIASTSIGRSSASYMFKGSNRSWNTCMFEYADPDTIKKDWDENRNSRKREINACNEYMGYDIYENVVDD